MVIIRYTSKKITTKAPKSGKKYKEVLEKGCEVVTYVGKNQDIDCAHGYTWGCDHCPIVAEKNKKEAVKRKWDGSWEQPRQCVKCKKEYPKEEVKENFYHRGRDKYGNPKIDTVCAACRREGAILYEAKKSAEKLVKKEKIYKDIAERGRDTREGFTYYMTKNPFYFSSQFGVEATPENIEREFLIQNGGMKIKNVK